jgi:hypothetical protein
MRVRGGTFFIVIFFAAVVQGDNTALEPASGFGMGVNSPAVKVLGPAPSHEPAAGNDAVLVRRANGVEDFMAKSMAIKQGLMPADTTTVEAKTSSDQTNGCGINLNIPEPKSAGNVAPPSAPGSSAGINGNDSAPPLSSNNGGSSDPIHIMAIPGTNAITPVSSNGSLAAPANDPSAQTPGAPISNTGVVDLAQNSALIGDEARVQDFVNRAAAERTQVIQNASDDQKALAKPYQNISNAAELTPYLQRAQTALGDQASTLESSVAGIDSSEKARFVNTFLNARDKAAAGLDAIQDDQQRKLAEESSPFAGINLNPGDILNPLAKTRALADVFGATLSTKQATTPDALTNRLVMLNGLPTGEREQVLGKLKLAESPTIKLQDGQSTQIPILHNGYILGAGITGTDCSAFMSSALPADVRKGRFTTLDFRTIWIYRKTGNFPNPPLYKKDREELIKKVSYDFIPIDLYSGEKVRAGDLLIQRYAKDPIGHMAMVKNYNPSNLRAEIMEASQSAGTIREREFSLSVNPQDPKEKEIKPGFLALRLKPVPTQACTYDKNAPGKRVPAAAKTGVSP